MFLIRVYTVTDLYNWFSVICRFLDVRPIGLIRPVFPIACTFVLNCVYAYFNFLHVHLILANKQKHYTYLLTYNQSQNFGNCLSAVVLSVSRRSWRFVNTEGVTVPASGVTNRIMSETIRTHKAQGRPVA